MTDLWESVAGARSVLFVPGHRSDRFSKAAESGADAIVLDLEDAVGPKLKAEARENVHRWLRSGGTGVVRINGMESPWYEEDVSILSDLQCAVMLPKITNAEQVARLTDRLAPGSCVIPLLETAAAILDAREACAVPGVIRAILGTADMGRELGVDYTDHTVLLYARSHLVLASSASGIAPPLDGATAALTDKQKLISDAEHAATLGFTGRVCLHPRQVPVVNAAFTPSSDEVRWARDVIATAGDGSVTVLNDQVIGKPVVERARRLLSRVKS